MIKLLKVASVILIISNLGLANDAKKLLEKFDLGMYSPQKQGLRDLVVTVEVPNIVEYLNKRKVFGTLKKIYFKVFWVFPGKYKIEVFGMPKGFEALKNELIQIIRSRLDFVIPVSLSKKFEKYETKYKRSANGFQIEGLDKTHTLDTNRINVFMDSKYKVRRINTFSPAGSRYSELSFSKKSGSKNKWLADKMNLEVRQGIQVTKMNYQISYLKEEGFVFPKQIDITTMNELVRAKDLDDKKDPKSTSLSIYFKDYKINDGIAKKEFK